MSVEDTITVAHRHLDALSRGDLDVAANCFASQSHNHGRAVARETIRQIMGSLHTLHERHTIEDVIAVGDKVVCRTTCHGLHDGAPAFPINGGVLNDVPPTGKEYTVQHIHIFQIADGQIVAHWANRDDLGMARQLGFTVVPPQ